MPHLKCEPCRARFPAVTPDESSGARCPTCDALLEPVENLADIVGYRVEERQDWHDLAKAVAVRMPDPDGGRVG